MQSVQTGGWEPRPPSKHASPPPSHSRLAHVTSATPAKRITFYKSGDSQFGGVRMAIHKRSFKCFDALLDDLSQKVPLPFGVRTVTTPRGTHTIKHLEQLQDGGCYLCSDQRQAKPINVELASKRPSMWYHHGRRPHRPETSSTTPPGHVHLPYRQRRILLVKNSEPGVRRSVVLNRRSTRSLRAFLDEVSEVMQFHVRKLYTVEGRKIDNVQSLMTCPGVLVCVGREAFSPMLVNFIRKSSEEKMSGLGPRTPGNGARSPATQGARSPPHGAHSRASEYSEGRESKKNVNFGLETKKSIIHPRSDSSNRSARFSLSSEKSYGNGVGAYPQGRPAIVNDDIEKRVLVNKDGSLSVEMRVRFRLHNDETLQWSTQIRKSPSLTNDCCPLSEAPPHYLPQGQSESCSDPDSATFDPEGMDYSSQSCALEGNHCPCCYHRQEQKYDLWENPAHSHKHPPHPPPHTSSHTHTMVRHTHSSSSSSSCNSRRVVRCRARLSNCGGGSGSEQSQMVQEEMCVTEQVEHRVEVEQDGDTHVEVCQVSQSCSRSEVIAVDSSHRPLSGKLGEVAMEEDEQRPVSAVSSSSHVLQSLKEDRDDEDDDLPPSASQCCYNCVPSQAPSPDTQVNKIPVSNVSTKQKNRSGVESVASSCHCGAAITLSGAGVDEMERALSSTSKQSETNIPKSQEEKDNRAVSGLSGHTGLSVNSKKSSSVCSNCRGCRRGPNSDVGSNHSNRASPKPASPICNQEIARNGSEDTASDGSAVSTQSNKTNLTDHGRSSAASNVLEGRASSAMSRTSNLETKDGEKTPSVASITSQRSSESHNSKCNRNVEATLDKEEERSPSKMSAQSSKSHKSTAEANGIKSNKETEGGRAASSLSVKSGASAKTGAAIKSNKPNCQSSAESTSLSDSTDMKEDDTNERAPSCLSVKSEKAKRPDSTVSAKSNVSTKTSKSSRSTCNHCAKPVSPGGKTSEEPNVEVTGEGEEAEEGERAVSALSGKPKKSQTKSDKASERSLSPKTGGDRGERAASEMSDRSVKSNNCVKPQCNGHEKDTENEDKKGENQAAGASSDKSASLAKSHHTNTEVVDRPTSAISARSHTSAKSQKSCHMSASLNQKNNTGQDRVPSAMSATSISSLRSSASHKSSSSKKPSSPQVITIKTPEDMSDGENGKGGDEKVVDGDAPGSKAPEHSCDQMLSPKRQLAPRIRSPKVPAASPTGSGSSWPQLSPGPDVGELNEANGLSTKSPVSVKSGRSKCCCGATSTKRDKEGENKEEKEGLKRDEASDEMASVRSSSSKRHSTSRNSSGSVSLGLPEDQDTADSDSGKSSVSFHRNTEGQARNRLETPTPVFSKTPEDSSSNQDRERAGSSNSQNSKSPASHNMPVVDIPIIETPGGGEDGDEENQEQKRSGATSVISVKSTVSHKSSCKCSIKVAAQRSNGESYTESLSDTESQDNRPACEAKEEDDIASNKAASVNSQNRCSLKPDSVASTQSESRSKASKKSQEKDTIKPDYLKPVQVLKVKSNAESDNGSVKSANSQKKKNSTKNLSPCPVHSKVDTCSESTLSAVDLLKETMATARPGSQKSKASKTSSNTRSEKSGKHQKRNVKDQDEVLTPGCLPNASPNEVVSDWLRSIPADSCMLALDDVLNEEDGEQTPKEVMEASGEEAAKKENPVDDKEDRDEKKPDSEEKEEEVKCDVVVEENRSKPAPGEASMSSNESLSKNWRSSAAVMKVLLNSSFGRCRSMPEVSPVYGRRLSTSARGLLDCLAQLQLIEPALNAGSDPQKDRAPQYEDIMAILHSLWLTDPRDLEGNAVNEGITEQVTPPRSSSGVGMSSGSGGSGKENGNQGGDETPPNKTDSLHGDETVVTAVEGKKTGDKEAKKQAGESDQTEEQSPDSPKATDNPSSSEKSSANGDSKTPTDNEQEIVEDSSSGTPPTVVRAPLSKRLSQDPDPVWVLHLLKKLEKQFMNHYIDAMTEFKVRWDLDDSVILDTMICELKDEVSQRIQKSVQLEMKKIQSRAGKMGRSPRPPPGANLSRESTMTEKRRRMLKVMKNQSVKTADSVSDGEMTGDFSDQRSDDEYCPCDACVRKKMAARPFKKNPLAADAPVMIEFDLLKILQLKKSPLPAPPVEPQPKEVDVDSEREEEEEEEEEEKEKERSLEVVQEEEEEDETKENIKADVVLEETIAEVDEEAQEEESSVDDEEQEEENEEEEEAECECRAKSEQTDRKVEVKDASNIADDDKKVGEEEDTEDDGETGEEERETGTGEEEEEEEESDHNTVKELSVDEGETTENEKSEKDADKDDEEEKADDEETSESREEESAEENNGELLAKKESTLVEEFVESNASTSTEDGDEDEGDVESPKDTKEKESDRQRDKASEEENASSKEQTCVCVTEGEDVDVSDSDTDSKRLSDAGGEDAVEEFKPEGAEQDGAEDGALLHQITKTSVESQPGSIEDADTDSSKNTAGSMEVPKVSGGGGGSAHRRSRSPARVKRRKPKETDEEMENC